MIPLQDFFRKPDRSQVTLSPGGGFVAYLAPFERRLNLHVQNLETKEVTRVTSVTHRDLAGYLWASDERLVYAQDQGGDENYRLYSVTRDGSAPKDLTPFEDVQSSIVDDLEDIDDEILFQMNQRNPEVFDVYRLDIRTGDMRMVAENPGNVSAWETDHDGRLRVAMTTDGVNTSLLYRDTEESDWREVASYSFKEHAMPLFFTFDNRDLYVSSNIGRDKFAICRLDPRSGEEIEVVFEHPEVDVSTLLSSKVRREVVGVVYEFQRPEHHFFDETRSRIQNFLDEQLPETFNQLSSHSKDETRFLVRTISDRGRGSCYLFDVPAMKLEKLFDLSPWLDAEAMAEMRPIQYPARDGKTIQGYLTLPRTPSAAETVPLIVNPHGGPWARDSWGFNPEVQFLASRGYAVLQMNFRGSTGFGREFWSASFGEWGLSMQDDITDAVRWAVDEGIADPDRMGIYGGSYGGYATLAGVTKTPDLYRCGVSYVGVSSIFTWIEAVPPYWKPALAMIHEMVGHPERDREKLEAASPLFHVGKIQVPMLFAQGANDPRVRKSESDQMVAALTERGIPVQYICKDNEGHGFQNEENNFEFYAAMEVFLSEHLGSNPNRIRPA